MAKPRSLKKKPRESNHNPNPSMATPSPLSRRRKPQTLATVSAILAVLLVISVVCLLLVSSNTWRAFQLVVSYETVTVVNVFPHDPQAFTQGLLYTGNDTLFESTGIRGKSSVRKVALRTGKVEKLKKLDGSLFGEGLTLLNNRLIQVTWQQTVGFIYDAKNLSKVCCFTFLLM
jgi:glutamine cyclotransferase